MPSRRDLALRAALYGLLLVAAAMTLTRQLTLEECATVRAGSLIVTWEPAEPQFFTPFTFLVGAVAMRLEDPGTLFVWLHAVTFGTVFGVLAWAFFRTGLPAPAKLGALALLLANGGFVVHGFGFGRGWPVLVGAGLALGLLQRPGRWAWMGLGGCVAWLLVHHFAGVFSGALLYLAVLVRLVFRSEDVFGGRTEKLSALAGFHLAAAAGLAVWAAVARLSGHFEALAAVPAEIADLAAGPRTTLGNSVGHLLLRDAVWLATALVLALATALAAVVGRRGRDGRPGLGWTAGFALAGIALCLVHPHPPPWTVALPAPFLALLMAGAPGRLAPWMNVRRWIVAIAVALGIQWVAGPAPGTVFLEGLTEPRTQQVETLRALAKVGDPLDRVLDPSGLVYFLPPVHPRWYLGGPYGERSRHGDWLDDLTISDRPGRWILVTRRLDLLPAGLRPEEKFVHVGGGLALPRGDPRVVRQRLKLSLKHREVGFFD